MFHVSYICWKFVSQIDTLHLLLMFRYIATHDSRVLYGKKQGWAQGRKDCLSTNTESMKSRISEKKALQ